MLNNIRYITINTDASFKDGIGSYAYWIKTDDKTYTSSGLLKCCIDNNEAEIMAILNTLYRVHSKEIHLKADRIVLNTDSAAAINLLSNGNLKYKDLYEKYLELKKKINLPIKFKKVKGHTSGKDSRHWVNNWCDREASKIRRKHEKFN